MRALVFGLVLASLDLFACAREGSEPSPGIDGGPSANERPTITPESAGFKDAPRVPFRHLEPVAGCVLDPVGRAGTCDVSGCSVPNVVEQILSEASLSERLVCDDAATRPPSGVDFTKSQVVFVRQGSHVGEWIRPQPVAWVVRAGRTLVIAEKHEVFCLGGADVNGGVVSYALVLPVETATLAIDRRIYRDPNGCSTCTSDDCGA